MTNLFRSLQLQREVFRQIVEPVSSLASDMAAIFDQNIWDNTSILRLDMQKSIDALAPKTKESVLELGRHGWYLDTKMAIRGLEPLASGLAQGNPNAESALVTYFENRMDEIEAEIVAKHPHRSKLIQAAFRAHRQQDYELSIPVLLAQTDGICFDIAKGSLFRNKDGKPQTAVHVGQFASQALTSALLSPLETLLPISASEKERAATPGFNHLNRHMVLHGESLDYGTKTNSLKAVSLLNYVAHILK